MNKAKHTPGPWYTRHGQISSETSAHGCTIANCNATAKGMSAEEVEANAALIAAAPDLLAALETFVHSVESEGVVYGRVVDAVINAESAIKKARGE